MLRKTPQYFFRIKNIFQFKIFIYILLYYIIFYVFCLSITFFIAFSTY